MKAQEKNQEQSTLASAKTFCVRHTVIERIALRLNRLLWLNLACNQPPAAFHGRHQARLSLHLDVEHISKLSSAPLTHADHSFSLSTPPSFRQPFAQDIQRARQAVSLTMAKQGTHFQRW